MKSIISSKSVLFVFVFICSGLVCFAQKETSGDTEKLLNGFVAEYNKDPYKFFKERLAEDFRYISATGMMVNRDQVLKDNEGRKSINSEVSEVKFFTDGNLAVSSGFHTFEGRKVAYTYTFIKRQDKWYFLASQHTAIAETK